MKNNILLDEILIMLSTFKNNHELLEKLHQYITSELYVAEDDESDPLSIPERFVPLVKDSADSLSAGLVCYINIDTLEKIDIPKSIVDDVHFNGYDEVDAEDNDDEKEEELEVFFDEKDFFYEDLKKVNRKWKQKIIINPPESHESFSFMEKFVNTLPEGRISKRLSDALSGRKPFAHFNNIIHQSDEREDWFAFRQKCLEKYVIEAIAMKLGDENSED